MTPSDNGRTPDAARELPCAAPMAQVALALFHEIECGLIVCDEQLRIRVANDAAQQEMASQRLLQRDGDRLLRAVGCRGDLDTLLRQAALTGRRSLLCLTQGDDELMVSMAPLRLPGDDASLALVILGRRQPCSELGLEMLSGRYGLTLAERRVLGALLRAVTPREIAVAHEVKLCTIRTQIASIQSKFGIRSIEGLMLRAAQVPPMAGALRLAGMSLPPAMSLAAH